jgi:hypothetical protein
MFEVRVVYYDTAHQIIQSSRMFDDSDIPKDYHMTAFGVYWRGEDGLLDHICDSGSCSSIVAVCQALNYYYEKEGVRA